MYKIPEVLLFKLVSLQGKKQQVMDSTHQFSAYVMKMQLNKKNSQRTGIRRLVFTRDWDEICILARDLSVNCYGNLGVSLNISVSLNFLTKHFIKVCTIFQIIPIKDKEISITFRVISKLY